MEISLFKTIHIIGFVSWFAGLFYIVRLFVYRSEAADKEEPKRSILSSEFQAMELKLYKIIMNPAMMITWTAGLIMIILHGWEWYKLNIWLHYKILFLVLLTFYHFYCGKLAKGKKALSKFDSFHLRIINEIPTLLLVVIVTLAVFKQNLNLLYFAIGLSIFIGLILWGLFYSKNKRNQHKK